MTYTGNVINELYDLVERAQRFEGVPEVKVLKLNAGMSICPICGKKWLVTPMHDCCLPACGCFGLDTSAANGNRPCENCGIVHYVACKVFKSPSGMLAPDSEFGSAGASSKPPTEADWARFLQKDGPDPEPEEE